MNSLNNVKNYAFYSLFESSQSLFWASFGMVGLETFELEGIKSYTRFWGLLMFGSYSVINVIVLLNLLIAMMSNSYAMIDVGIFTIFFVHCLFYFSFTSLFLSRFFSRFFLFSHFCSFVFMLHQFPLYSFKITTCLVSFFLCLFMSIYRNIPILNGNLHVQNCG